MATILDQIGINPLNLAAQIVNFGILYVVLSKVLYKPVMKLLDTRAKKIAQGLKAAEENVKKAEEFEARKKTEMAKVRAEMEKMLESARQEAARLSEEIVQKAKNEAKRQTQNQYQLLSQRMATQEARLKEKVGKISLEMTRKILTKALDGNLQDKIIAASLKKWTK